MRHACARARTWSGWNRWSRAKARGGTGAVGVKDIERALVNGQVRELYLTSAFVQDHTDEAVDAIRRAFDEGAKVEHVSGDAAQRLDAAGGIAARLRFTIANDGASGLSWRDGRREIWKTAFGSSRIDPKAVVLPISHLPSRLMH